VERKKYFYVVYKEKKVVFEQPLLSGLPLCKQLMFMSHLIFKVGNPFLFIYFAVDCMVLVAEIMPHKGAP
jgi:hypothetical protein